MKGRLRPFHQLKESRLQVIQRLSRELKVSRVLVTALLSRPSNPSRNPRPADSALGCRRYE